MLLIGAAGPAAVPHNPIVPGWYADPEIRRFGGQYWIYPTTSEAPADAPAPRLNAAQRRMRAAPNIRPAFLTQTYLDAFSSPDLVHWTRHPRILDTTGVDWAAYAIWAPSAIRANGRYYLFFGANDVHEGEIGGIGVAVADRPQGPFRDLIGKPLIGGIHHGAQPIDQFAFRDDNGQLYLYYGGWGHLNVVRLAPDLKSLRPFADGTTYREITPPGYVEGSFLIKRRGIYYLMWSEGGWTGPDYRVAYATGPSALGPFTVRGTILAQDDRVARGAGHHSAIREPGSDRWWIAYHRRPLSETKGDHRVLAVDRLYFNADGTIRPVVMTGR
ncbi:arabinan endo-1,5-alpha-L-arabinosidase [Sphingomonas sp. MA1305]|uniref:glycoside hydrolase family 43 protein n=1 Tax=Sphingomonas sp. MA1305 TaxID=2479204 RepID=UPI0018DFB64F|nr:glycoside hydrolase family 43 protein [Sphingomonas sp. MA1305]MBI0476409.1 arabinan endo-1,5-alpha-L-arabinosidase [Sphingomonas sp. MA1305]